MYPLSLSLHTLGAGNWQYLYLAQLLAAAENIYQIRPITQLWKIRLFVQSILFLLLGSKGYI